MTLPIENYLAAFPPVRTVRMGWLRRPVVLGPLTLGGAVALDALGVDPQRGVPVERAAIAAYVLTRTDFNVRTSNENDARFRSFSRRVRGHLKELCKAVNETLQEGFSTYVKPPDPKNPVSSLTPHGIGWWLSYAESMCSDYGWSWSETLATPLATVFALSAASRERYGIDHGDADYVERQYIKMKKSRGEW